MAFASQRTEKHNRQRRCFGRAVYLDTRPTDRHHVGCDGDRHTAGNRYCGRPLV
jgi:hypothetical protein